MWRVGYFVGAVVAFGIIALGCYLFVAGIVWTATDFSNALPLIVLTACVVFVLSTIATAVAVPREPRDE